MFDRTSIPPQKFWRHEASALARRLNFHHWLSQVVPKLFVLLIGVAVFDLAGRKGGFSPRWTALILGLGLVAVFVWAWLEARRHFCGWPQALVRLETKLGLHNQLSSAEAGVVKWPAPQNPPDAGYRLNWRQLMVPLLAGDIFLACAHYVPVGHARSTARVEAISEPPELAQVQSWINALKAQDLIQPDKLQEMQAALDRLRERPRQDWYTQDNLEAANSLKQLAEQSMNSLAQGLGKADEAVQSLRENAPSPGNSDALQPVRDQLRSAGQNLASGNLPLNQEMVASLKDAAGASDRSLTAAQLAALHERLKNGRLTAQTALKADASFSEEMQEAMDAAAMNGGGLERRTVAGAGGVGGGKETAPLELEQRDKTSPDGKLTPVQNDDMSRASLGQTTKISAGAHQVDPTAYAGLQQAGSAQTGGNGGDAVWRGTYDPQDAETLDRFFK
jgi:hypothetical protein